MGQLRRRLGSIAEHIGQEEVVADIGTDHGQLPVHLCEQHACAKVIMTDISEASLAKAKVVGAPYLQGTALPEEEATLLEARVGDGLAPLAEGEADVVVMAGIGGRLMAKILQADPGKARSMGRYLLQPRKAVGELREYLTEAGYRIHEEWLVEEGKFLWEILLAVPPESPYRGGETLVADPAEDPFYGRAETALLWEVPAYCGDSADPLMGEYLRRKLEREETKLHHQGKAAEAQPEVLAGTRANIAYLKELMERQGRL